LRGVRAVSVAVKGSVGSMKMESVESASMMAGAMALMIFFVVGWLWMDGMGRPLVHTREVDCAVTAIVRGNYGDVMLTSAECGAFALEARPEVDLVEGGVYRFTIGETDPFAGRSRTVAAEVEEPVPPRALGGPGVPVDVPHAPWAGFVHVAFAVAGFLAFIWIVGGVLTRWWRPRWLGHGGGRGREPD
jgi:hypothetical protein